MVEQHHRPRLHRFGALERPGQRLDFVDPLAARLPGQVEQLVAPAARQCGIVIGDHHRGQPGIDDIGVRKPDEQAGAKRAFLFHRAAAGLDLLVRRIEARLAHDVRQHRALAPGHGGRGLALEHRKERLAGANPGFVDIDVRIRLVAGDHVRVLHDRAIQVGVHVERDRNWRFRRDLAHSRDQLAFAILEALGHHRAMQVEQDGVAAGFDGLADPARHVLEGRVLDRPARPRVARDRQRDRGARLLRKLDEGADRGTRPAQRLDRRLALERARRADREAPDRRGHRREGVGLVLHLGNDDFHWATGAPRSCGPSGPAANCGSR